ncbi:MAGE family-domain-containing protein [Stachybotrys elegans]|uniref:MAGE family-domain-containing protein n=1 Tax=Stachybotrys elegans TaxID=80388 RepID=A0A8K0SFH9_9HYPO|nr:MAGE family-domain-containing protein [Stachybotrys elegans]
MPPSQRRRRDVVEDDDMEEEQRPRQRQNRDETEDDASMGSDEDTTMGGLSGNGEDDQLAKKLVRYAISCEYARTPIKRDGIREKVLGNQSRSFRRIFSLAQHQLRSAWGMELRELPTREKMSLHERRQAMKSNSQPKLGSRSYILTSTLPDAYRDPAILCPSKTPSAEAEATYVAFYTMMVSLIWLNSGELSDQKLRRYLMRLNADQNVSTEKTEMTLKKMERQGYVIKKTERPPVGQDGEQSVSWLVGPRAKEEIGLDGVLGMTREVYGDSNPELEKKLRASLGIRENADEDGSTSRNGGGRMAEGD